MNLIYVLAVIFVASLVGTFLIYSSFINSRKANFNIESQRLKLLIATCILIASAIGLLYRYDLINLNQLIF